MGSAQGNPVLVWVGATAGIILGGLFAAFGIGLIATNI